MTISDFFRTCWFVLPAVAVAAYLLGSISFAILVTRLFVHDDIRNYGSGNAGATNVLRSQGTLPALLTTAGDLGKSVVAVLLARWFTGLVTDKLTPGGYVDIDPVLVAGYTAGLFCILGHMYPLYFGFRGGKGVLSILGMGLVVDWRLALICLGIFVVILLLSHIVSLGSVIAVGCVPITAGILGVLVDHQSPITVSFCVGMTSLLALLVIIKHWANIGRIVKGTESKISFHKKKED